MVSKKTFVFILCSVFLIGMYFFFVSSKGENVSIVAISGIFGRESVSGFGVCIEPQKILTSAHVVYDGRMKYQVASLGDAIIFSRDEVHDTALLHLVSARCMPIPIYRDSLFVGQKVFARVMRKGGVEKLQGSITAISPQILGYDSVGNTLLFTPQIETNIEFFPGESGVPIFDSWGRVIDIAHVAKK